MKDLATKNTCRGVNGQSKRDKSPPAAHSVESCCGSWLKSIKLWVPVDYKNETVQFLKLAGPVVRLCLDAIVDESQQYRAEGTQSATIFRMIASESY